MLKDSSSRARKEVRESRPLKVEFNYLWLYKLIDGKFSG